MKNAPASARENTELQAPIILALILWLAAGIISLSARPPGEIPVDYVCVPGPAGEKIVVPTRVLADEDSCSPAVSYLLGHRFDLNEAAVEDLDLLPGIGPSTAQKLIAFRDRRGGLKNLAELEEVKGLSAEARESLRRWSRLRPEGQEK